MVVVGALLIGLFLSWIISFINSITVGMAMRGKESKIKDYKKENNEYLKQIHKLELENARLKGETDSLEDDKSL
jgi:hypothetical protein